ncbi:uncharacterized protein [Amphiura filiformis]|uniref:uncharacterized protein isoform X2 n=1 Tax=Amphiura filiformis TaxID=82378 RepID=UPI003B21725C
MWQELRDHGILRNKLIEHVWKDWIGIKQGLLELMERFDMLFRQPAEEKDEKEKDSQTGDKELQPTYCVPACLHPKKGDPKKGNENMTDGTFYVDFGTFLPDGFFHRVLVHFARWSSQHTDKAPKLFYRFCKSFVGPENNRHICSLQMIQSSEKNGACIKITLKKVAKVGEKAGSTGESDPVVCTRVFEFMSKTLDELRVKWAKGIKYTMSVGCVACREEGQGKLHLIPVEKCSSGSYLCSDTDKEIPAKRLYWKAVDTGVSSSTEKPKPQQGRHIMISYSWGPKDKGFPCQKRMVSLKDELVKAGFPVWLDVQEMRGSMDARMAEAVDGAFVILLCYSKEYQLSTSCRKEAQYASYQGKEIIPLKFDNHRPDGWLGLLICNLLYHDVRSESAMLENLPNIIKDINACPEVPVAVGKPSEPESTNGDRSDKTSPEEKEPSSEAADDDDEPAAPVVEPKEPESAKDNSQDQPAAAAAAESPNMTWRYRHTVDPAAGYVWGCHMVGDSHLAVGLDGCVKVYQVGEDTSKLVYTLLSDEWAGRAINGAAISKSLPNDMLVICNGIPFIYIMPCIKESRKHNHKYKIRSESKSPQCIAANASVAVIGMWNPHSYIVCKLADLSHQFHVELDFTPYDITMSADSMVVMRYDKMVVWSVGVDRKDCKEMCTIKNPDGWRFEGVSFGKDRQVYAACKQGGEGGVYKYTWGGEGKPEYINSGCIIEGLGVVGSRNLSVTSEGFLAVGQMYAGNVKIYKLQ